MLYRFCRHPPAAAGVQCVGSCVVWAAIAGRRELHTGRRPPRRGGVLWSATGEQHRGGAPGLTPGWRGVGVAGLEVGRESAARPWRRAGRCWLVSTGAG